MTDVQINKELIRIWREAQQLPANEQLALIKRELQALDATSAFTIETMLVGMSSNLMAASEKQLRELETSHNREMRTFYTGLALLAFSLLVSVAARDIRPMTAFILRVMVGLSVGLIIAFVPGIFSLDAKVNRPSFKFALKGTGAAAGFLTIFLIDPGWISSMHLFSR